MAILVIRYIRVLLRENMPKGIIYINSIIIVIKAINECTLSLNVF